MPSSKNQTLIFFVFFLDFCATVRTIQKNCTDRMDYTDLEIHAQIFFLENCTQKSALKIIPYGPTINAVVFSLIFVPSLLLSFPSICKLQIFSSCSGKMETFSLLSLSALFSLQSAKVRQNASLAFLSKP